MSSACGSRHSCTMRLAMAIIRPRQNTRFAELLDTQEMTVDLCITLQELLMVRSKDQLEAQLPGLPSSDRARLAEILLASLDAANTAGSLAETEKAWRAESERRLVELRQGTVVGIPADQVFTGALTRQIP